MRNFIKYIWLNLFQRDPRIRIESRQQSCALDNTWKFKHEIRKAHNKCLMQQKMSSSKNKTSQSRDIAIWKRAKRQARGGQPSRSARNMIRGRSNANVGRIQPICKEWRIVKTASTMRDWSYRVRRHYIHLHVIIHVLTGKLVFVELLPQPVNRGLLGLALNIIHVAMVAMHKSRCFTTYWSPSVKG